jgi:iron complex outermembrane receptor protein
LLISVPFSLCAEEEEVTLEEVVVTATRDVQEIRKVPANVTVITREEIERSYAQTTVDLLRDEVGVTVSDLSGTGKNVFVDIRGFGETAPQNILVLMDGRRVNEIDLSAVDWTQVPLEQIERIEIIRGPGSVLYGDNAVGGVINIITKKPEKTFSADGSVTAGSYHYNKESGSVSGKWGPLSAFLHADYNATNGYRENGFLRGKDVGGRILYDLSDKISFNFSGNFHRDDTGLPGALSRQELHGLGRDETTHPADKAETEDGYASLGLQARLWNVGRIETDLSYRHRELSDFLTFITFFGPSTFQSRRNLSTWGLTPRYILDNPLWNHPNKLTLGLDYYKSDSHVDSESFFGGSTTFDGLEVTKKSYGLYFLDEFSVLDNLILSFGGRQEWVTYEFSQDSSGAKDRVKDREPAWSVGLNYLFRKGSSAFLSVKRSFRFPVSDELIQFFPVFQANTAIEPQTGYHYEAGIRHPFTDEIEANMTIFWTDIHDEIIFNPLTFTNENFPKTRRTGVETGLKVIPFSWLHLWGNYTYIRPLLRKEPFSGNDIPGVPRHKGSAGADFHLGRGFLLNARTNIVGSRHFISDFANRVERLGGYYTLDAKLSYAWKGLRAFIGVNNITNQKFSEFGVVDAVGTQFFYPSPERNFIGGISYIF